MGFKWSDVLVNITVEDDKKFHNMTDRLTVNYRYLAVEWDLGAVECHQKMVDNNRDVVGGQQQHQDNLKRWDITGKSNNSGNIS